MTTFLARVAALVVVLAVPVLLSLAGERLATRPGLPPVPNTPVVLGG